jgi:hypothetical protein
MSRSGRPGDASSRSSRNLDYLPVKAGTVTTFVDLWAPFALRVRCGRLELRAITDDDIPGIVDLVLEGLHEPGQMPFASRGRKPRATNCRGTLRPTTGRPERRSRRTTGFSISRCARDPSIANTWTASPSHADQAVCAAIQPPPSRSPERPVHADERAVQRPPFAPMDRGVACRSIQAWMRERRRAERR